jgi:hypothetical protein
MERFQGHTLADEDILTSGNRARLEVPRLDPILRSQSLNQKLDSMFGMLQMTSDILVS